MADPDAPLLPPCLGCGSRTPEHRPDCVWAEEEDPCSWCGGELTEECVNPLECMLPASVCDGYTHWGWCSACQGAGVASRQVIW